MNTVKKLFYSSVSTFSMVFLFLLLILVGRYLGRDEYGIFTTALSIAMIAEILADFGLRDLCLRNVARDLEKTSVYIGNLITWKIAVAALVFTGFFLVVNLLDYAAEVRRIIFIMVTASLAKSIKYTFRLFLQAHGRFDLDALIEGTEKVLLLAAGFGALFIWKDLYVFVIAFCLIRVLGIAAILAVIHLKISRISPLFNFRFSRKLQMEAVPFGLFGVVFVVLSYVDSIMLSQLRDFGEVGLYNAAFRIFEGVTILPSVFFMVMLPKLSRLAVEDPAEHRRLSARVVNHMIILAWPITLIGGYFSGHYIDFFGADFQAASLTLRILFSGILFQFPTWMLNTVLISINKQKVMLAFAAAGLAANVILNVIVIPLYGYNGAALATVAAEVVMCTGIMVYLYRHQLRIPLLLPVLRAGGAALVTLGLISLIPVAGLPAALAVTCAGMCLYGVLIMVIGGLENNERRQIFDLGRHTLKKLGFLRYTHNE